MGNHTIPTVTESYFGISQVVNDSQSSLFKGIDEMASIYSDEYQSVIKSLREARIAKGITQENLAQAMERPQSFIAKVENGERKLDIVEFIHIARLLSIDPAEIITKIPIKHRPLR